MPMEEDVCSIRRVVYHLFFNTMNFNVGLVLSRFFIHNHLTDSLTFILFVVHVTLSGRAIYSLFPLFIKHGMLKEIAL